LSLKNKFIAGFGWNTLTVASQSIIQLVYVAFLARLISQEAFALMGVALSLVGFAEIFSQIGFGPALIQRKEITQEHINGAFFTSVILGVLFTLGFVLAAPSIAEYYDIPELEPVIQVISISFTLSALAIVPKSLLFKKMDFKKFFTAAVVSIVGGNLIVGLTLAFLDYDVWAYVWALFVQGALMAIMTWVLNPIKITWKWSWPHTRQLVRYGGGSTLFNSLNYLATRLDVLLVPKLTAGTSVRHNENLGQAGVYERSTYMMMIPVTIMGKLADNVMFSGMSIIQEDKVRLRKAYASATYIISLLLMPACVFVILFAEEIVLLYLGKGYTSAIPVVQVLFSVVAFRSLIKLSDSLLRAVDAVFKGSLIKLIFLVLIGIGTWVGIDWGITGVAVGVAIATMIQYIMMMIFCKSLIGVSYSSLIRKMSPGLAVSAFVALISLPIFWFSETYLLSNWLTLLIAVAVNGLGVILLIFAIPTILGQGNDNILVLVAQKLPDNKIIRAVLKRLNR
jgi:PST family polysaccharide transporter